MNDNDFANRQDPLAEVRQQAVAMFAFLHEQKGLQIGPTDSSRFGTSYCYLSRVIGLEINLSAYDEMVLFNVLKLRKGKVPPDGFEANNEWVRMPYLFTLKNLLGIEDKDIDIAFSLMNRTYGQFDPKHPSFKPESYYIECLHAYHLLVERYFDFVIQQPLERIFPNKLILPRIPIESV